MDYMRCTHDEVEARLVHGPDHDAAGYTPRALSMLVVDEDEIARQVIARRFTDIGYTVLLAADGLTALEMAVAHRFDIIIVNCGMCRVSSVDTIRRLRASRGSCISIVSVGPQDDSKAELEALQAGADEHVIKPFDFDVVDMRIRHVLGRARQLEDLTRYNDALDARIARRAMELGEIRAELQEMKMDRSRLICSIRALHEELARLKGSPARAG